MTFQDVDAERVEGTIWVIRANGSIIEKKGRFTGRFGGMLLTCGADGSAFVVQCLLQAALRGFEQGKVKRR
jgi:hypothetical protein